MPQQWMTRLLTASDSKTSGIQSWRVHSDATVLIRPSAILRTSHRAGPEAASEPEQDIDQLRHPLVKLATTASKKCSVTGVNSDNKHPWNANQTNDDTLATKQLETRKNPSTQTSGALLDSLVFCSIYSIPLKYALGLLVYSLDADKISPILCHNNPSKKTSTSRR